MGITKETVMKKILISAFCCLNAMMLLPAQAGEVHGYGHGGWRSVASTPRVVAHLKTCRDTLVPMLQAIPGVQVAPARGGMYAFFRLEGHPDSLQTAKRLVVEAGLGLAPGDAFAPEAAGWLRWCFASKDLNRLAQGVDRLKSWLARN